MSSPVVAAIALGSNLGDRAAHLRSAIDALGREPGIRVLAVSAPLETEPVGPPGQGPYLNAAARIETTLGATALLAVLLGIERAAGRERRGAVRWGPRTLDLDLLLLGDRVIRRPGLEVPHPRMHGRDFVLRPLAEVGADLVHPVLGRTVRELLGAVADPATTE